MKYWRTMTLSRSRAASYLLICISERNGYYSSALRRTAIKAC